jgi:hypothetical protein
MEKSR